MIKKGINIVIILILSLLVILPKNFEKNVTDARTVTEEGQTLQFITPYIEYMGENFYTGNTMYFNHYNALPPSLTDAINYPIATREETVSFNNETYRHIIYGIEIGYNNNNMSFVIRIAAISLQTNVGVFTRLTYNQNYENGNLTFSDASYYYNFFGVTGIQELYNWEWTTTSEYENVYNTYWNNNTNIKYFNQFIQGSTSNELETPTLTLNLMTLEWNEIENAEYYTIYRNGTAVYTTYTTQYTTIQNGNYQVQACVSADNEEYSNSELSNIIEQNNYNDLIGNGANFFTLFSAIIDSQLYLIKSMLNYELWGINIFNVFKLLVTVLVLWYIYKLIKKG